ncbi:MAG: dTDP-4-dehydrorhamnose reductase [Aquificaceae bacterium]|nr:dTDP-4-dehydrorhamnose reductase [Aquificaceae bacterium]MDW8237488.1 dTDP-4-dehydrorhamnose reductase [Aquificaceae bacterium]
MKVLITGANGQLGQEFQRLLEQSQIQHLALSKQQLDITNFRATLEAIENYAPSVVINCAAYNQVDKAENEPHSAIAVNAIGVQNLAYACEKVGATLVHYSTDYVFSGSKRGLYIESDEPSPLNNYGLSKLIGENLIKNSIQSYLIFRTSWVFGKGTQNFLYKLSQWASSSKTLRIACDEFSVPTWTYRIAIISLKAIENSLNGLYHLTSKGFCSRYELAKEFFKLKNKDIEILPAYQSEFNLPAKRPNWSAMDSTLLLKTLSQEPIEWQEDLERFLKDDL